MGYAYTAGPFPLAYRGLGDLFVLIFFGLIAVGGVYFLHAQSLAPGMFLAGLQIGLHCTVLIAINNLRDMDGDRLVQKRTLAVRFGQRFSRFEIAFLCGSPFLLGYAWVLWGHPFAFFLPLLAAPLAIKIAKSIYQTAPGTVYNKFLGMAAGLHLLFGVCLSIGLLL
jgi:1,4-dihydroxy-2-naphthoate octaprenyltransferase